MINIQPPPTPSKLENKLLIKVDNLKTHEIKVAIM
jgi:hypothetical protein